MTVARTWGGYEFAHVAELRPKRDAASEILTDLPQMRYAKAAGSPLHAYGKGPFCKFTIPWSLSAAGVYVITANDRVLYVGECRHLAQRFNMGYGTIQPRNCFQGGQATNCKVNHRILGLARQGATPALWFREEVDRKRVESELLRLLDPPWNGRG